ncbi:MAG TPA: hypothetical protein VGD17_01390 [Chitinophagaceae bacterium]
MRSVQPGLKNEAAVPHFNKLKFASKLVVRRAHLADQIQPRSLFSDLASALTRHIICRILNKPAMKSKIILLMLGIMVMASLTYAQQSTDSAAKNKQQQRITKLTERIDENKQKLVRLEKELEEKIKEQEKAAAQAEESADKNREAAVKLSNDAEDRKKAKRVEKLSDQAKRDAKRARRASSNVKGLENNIKQLKRRIAEDEKTLSGLSSINS